MEDGLSLIERIVSNKNKIAYKLEEKHPKIAKLAKKFRKSKRYGFQITDGKGGVLEEYTMITDGNYIDNYVEGLVKVKKIVSIKKSLIEDMLAEEGKFLKHPFVYSVLEFPKYIKYIKKGRYKIKKHKKKDFIEKLLS